MELTPMQMDIVRVALQAHAVLIQQTLAALQPPPSPPQD